MSSLIRKRKIHTNSFNSRKFFAKRQVERAIRSAFSVFENNSASRNVFQDLLLHVRLHTGLLKTSLDHHRLWPEACTYILGLQNLSAHCNDFIRPVQTWKPIGQSRRRIFASLAHHLLAEYPVQFFMNSVWLRPMDDCNRNLQDWYIKISRGHSIRRLQIPVHMTKRMEHIFLQTPDHFSMEEAVRNAQVLGLGGTKKLAMAVLATRLGRNPENETFWETVLHFFINARELSPDDVNPIVDFLYHTKFARREVHTDDGVMSIEPPQPDFSVKGRTFRSIMRLVESWHQALAVDQNDATFTWRKSKINEFLYLEEIHHPHHAKRIWRITELLSGAELAAEGKAMKHCVRSYARSCFHGKTTIWSMKREVNQNLRRMLTIEVNPFSRKILQARGKCNSRPDKKSFMAMKKWMQREGLSFSSNC